MKALCVLLLLISLPGVSWAGQIHYHDITLSQVPLTLLVQLLGVVEAGKKIRVKVLRVWKKKGFLGGPDTYVAGSAAVVSLKEPYEWTDPHKSPIVSRYWDELGALPKLGERLLLVDSMGGVFEATAYTAAKAAKFELFADPAKLADSIRRSKDQTLFDNYRDRDLRALSVAEIRRRGVPLGNFLKHMKDAKAFFELLGDYHYVLEKDRAQHNLRALVRNVAAFSDPQRAWLVQWMLRNLRDKEHFGLEADVLMTAALEEPAPYQALSELSADFFRELEGIQDLALIEKFTRLFLKGLEQNPAQIGDSLHGPMVEKLINKLPAAKGRKLRRAFVRAVARASRHKVIEKDPEHLIMYFLVSHLRASKDTDAIGEFAKIDFRHPMFKRYFQYAVELLIDDEKERGSHDRARVRKFVESYPAGEFLQKMDADKRSRYDEFVR